MPDDDLRKIIDDLIEEWGLSAVLVEVKRAYDERPKRTAGRPRVMSKNAKMHVWIAIEIERYRRKIRSVNRTVEMIFQERHGKPWIVVIGDDDRPFGETVRRWHTDAKELMKANPKLAKRWQDNLASAKNIIDTGWGRNLVKKKSAAP